MLLKFESVSHPVRMAQGMKLLPHLVRVFAKWPFREVPAAGSAMPQINVMQDGESYILQAPWVAHEQRYENAIDLADGLPGHLAQAHLNDVSDALLLNAAAARFGDGLVVFLGSKGSGKNLLSMCLAVSRHKIFADTALLIDGRESVAMALGVSPRLEMPTPTVLSGALRQLVEIHSVNVAERFAYLKPEKELMASHGERVPVRALVILDRKEGAEATLRSVDDSRMLKRLMLSSLDGHFSGRESLEILHGLVRGASCHRLTWSDPQRAIAALRARFAIRRAGSDEEENALKKPARTHKRRQTAPRSPAGRLFRHGQGLSERPVDNDLFIADGTGEAVYHLNGLGAGMWRLLDGTHGLDDIVAILSDAFPTVDPICIKDDVNKLVADLQERGLLVEQDERAAV